MRLWRQGDWLGPTRCEGAGIGWCCRKGRYGRVWGDRVSRAPGSHLGRGASLPWGRDGAGQPGGRSLACAPRACEPLCVAKASGRATASVAASVSAPILARSMHSSSVSPLPAAGRPPWRRGPAGATERSARTLQRNGRPASERAPEGPPLAPGRAGDHHHGHLAHYHHEHDQGSRSSDHPTIG